MIIALQTLIFFRESLITALERLFRPYYKRFSLGFNRNGNVSEDEEPDEQVFSEFDDEKGVVFYPPMYAQRYAAVSDCLMDVRWSGKLEKVVDLGYHDMSFIKYLKEVPGVKCILGVDIESIPLKCSSDLLACDDYISKRETPLQITLFQGNSADPDFRLIGCDAVIAIEMIEHMLPHDLDRLVHNIFGFIKPWIVVVTTPNADFNVLFKALEKNGLRRWDHLFEWTREQFHDWCSNIVVRYPEYTVSCKGIGPGPPGTIHLGCCSQLALFISKDYRKQPDLDINSLALVANAPKSNIVTDMVGSWENTEDTLTENKMICPPPNTESISEFLFSDNQSCMTILIASPTFSIESLEYHDKTSQCNLDTEHGRNFLMFNDEDMCCPVLMPRRNIRGRVYEIEDVASRLNCTTFQVKKFSKTTQNLMAKNKMDSLVHTREVVDEIKHLTSMLNFNKKSLNEEEGSNIWRNINWGENAPYWNQYYKIVREYNYPFETKSEECRILDLISDEINKLIDMHCDEEFSVDVNKLEIPLTHLVQAVSHITEDVERVKDILEWNGYEIVDDVVIHSRMVVDCASVGSRDEDWQDNETFSDWDTTTDVRSTSISDGSTMVPDVYDKYLRRALDRKVRNLRTMLSADEDITSELDRVVCRLMKLALRSSKGRQNPPPTRWMQCKLFDLLTLTEKTVERRRRRFIESYPLKAIEYGSPNGNCQDIITIVKMKQDNTTTSIFDKYHHLVQPTSDSGAHPENHCVSFEIDDDTSATTPEYFKDKDNSKDKILNWSLDPKSAISATIYEDLEVKADKEKSSIERTETWLAGDTELIQYKTHDTKSGVLSSGDTDHSASNVVRANYKKAYKKHRTISFIKSIDEFDVGPCKRHRDKTERRTKFDDKNKDKTKTHKFSKKVVRKKCSSRNVIKTYNTKTLMPHDAYNELKSKIEIKEQKMLLETSSKSLTKKESHIDDNNVDSSTENVVSEEPVCVAATENSRTIDIITDEVQETIALLRTIGTDADVDPVIFEQDKVDTSSLVNEREIATENVQSHTIFLFDINEPSTSKGVRHISLDVQCGPDTEIPAYTKLSATTSLSRMPKMFTGIKIEDSMLDIRHDNNRMDFGSSTNVNDTSESIILNPKVSTGINIKDSNTMFCQNADCSTSTNNMILDTETATQTVVHDMTVEAETKMIKPISSGLNMDDSVSELCESVGSLIQSASRIADSSTNASNVHIKFSLSKEMGIGQKYCTAMAKCVRSKLSCGGVHVHSYRDREVYEDVVYQGEWQQHKTKNLNKKKTIISKKGADITKKKILNTKDQVNVRTSDKINTEPKKLILLRNTWRTKTRQDTNDKKNDKAFPTPNSLKSISRCNKYVPKVTSKLAASTTKTISKYNSSQVPKRLYQQPRTSPTAAKPKNNTPETLKKNYVQLKYATRKPNVSNDKILNQSIDSVKTVIKVNKPKPISKVTPLLRSKTEEIKKELLKFNTEPTNHINYTVFRNELETTNSDSNHKPLNTPKERKSGDSSQRSQSPLSQNSSTGSSRNSIATVRAIPTRPKSSFIRRQSLISNKNKLEYDTDDTAPSSYKKYTKRSKSARKSNDKDFENKENIPGSSNKHVKSAFMVRSKNVYVAQLTTDNLQMQSTLTGSSKHKIQPPNKSNVKIPVVENSVLKKKPSSSVLKKTSCVLKSSTSTLSSDNNSEEHKYITSDNDRVLALKRHGSNKPQKKRGTVVAAIPKSSRDSLFNYNESTPNNDNNCHLDTVVNNSETLNTIKHIIEEQLTFIDKELNYSETSPLQIESIKNISYSGSLKSLTSYEDNANIVGSDTDNVLNDSFDMSLSREDNSEHSTTDRRLTTTDCDLLSFKSLTSVSKFSEYFLADSDLNDTLSLPQDNLCDASSVKDIFERKELPLMQSPGGVLAIQAFSGFSMNAEPVAGDQPDYVNLIDSETGSLALELARQTASEELIISGRSSGSFESCLVDDDSVVPDWLFQIITQQQSIEEAEEEPQQLLLPVPIALVDPIFDANGNILEPGVGIVGAGAGDGRGMHSDQSQDSSGQGTSMSSSDSSSEAQSEATLINPLAFTGQFELPLDGALMITSLAIPPDRQTVYGDEENENALGSSRGAFTRDRLNSLLATSDADADVSSLDTDVPDSSDN